MIQNILVAYFCLHIIHMHIQQLTMIQWCHSMPCRYMIKKRMEVCRVTKMIVHTCYQGHTNNQQPNMHTVSKGGLSHVVTWIHCKNNDQVYCVYYYIGTIKLATYGEFQTVTMKFNGDWVKGTAPGGDIKAVFNIDNMLLRRRWSAYKSSLPCQWQQTEEHYHGTKLCCNISEDKDLCCAPDCAICQIADAGFDQLKIRTNIPSFQRFGHGFYLSPKSSKCHDYTQGAYGFRALLICDVCVGRKYPLTKNDQSLNGPPDGYHSIHGQVGKDLNYEEIVLPKADAILPKYIVVYRKDDERKIAK